MDDDGDDYSGNDSEISTDTGTDMGMGVGWMDIGQGIRSNHDRK